MVLLEMTIHASADLREKSLCLATLQRPLSRGRLPDTVTSRSTSNTGTSSGMGIPMVGRQIRSSPRRTSLALFQSCRTKWVSNFPGNVSIQSGTTALATALHGPCRHSRSALVVWQSRPRRSQVWCSCCRSRLEGLTAAAAVSEIVTKGILEAGQWPRRIMGVLFPQTDVCLQAFSTLADRRDVGVAPGDRFKRDVRSARIADCLESSVHVGPVVDVEQ